MKDITAMPTMFLDVCILDFSQSENETLGTSEWDLRDLSQDKYIYIVDLYPIILH